MVSVSVIASVSVSVSLSVSVSVSVSVSFSVSVRLRVNSLTVPHRAPQPLFDWIFGLTLYHTAGSGRIGSVSLSVCVSLFSCDMGRLHHSYADNQSQ